MIATMNSALHDRDVSSASKWFLFVLLSAPACCFAEHMTGEMSAWELLWYSGATDYPHRWWHGTGPTIPIIILVIASWYLLRLLTKRR